nr:DUF2975 domain-containing protein [Micromonospora sp. DSM 115978]
MRGFVEQLRKPDWLAEMRAVLIAGLVLVAAVGIGSPVLALTGGREIVVAVPASTIDSRPEAGSGGPGSEGSGRREEGLAGLGLDGSGSTGGARVRESSAVEVYVVEPTTGQLVADTLAHLPSLAVVAVLLGLLLQVVVRARRGEPFSGYVVRRLRVAAVVALAGGCLASLVETVATLGLAMSVSGSAGLAHWAFPLPWILAGFALFAVAEVIGRGVAMRAELDTVV